MLTLIFLTLLAWECILRLSVSECFFSLSFIRIVLFSSAYAFGISAIIHVCSKTIKPYVYALVMGLTALLYSAQLVYYSLFDTFFITYSAVNFGKTVSFAKEALPGIFAKAIPILAIIGLLAASVFMFIKKINVAIYKPRSAVLMLSLAICFYLVTLGTLNIHATPVNSAYQLYYHDHHPVNAVHQLGLITYMQVDGKRHLTGWEPSVSPIAARPSIITLENIESDAHLSHIPDATEDVITYNELPMSFEGLGDKAIELFFNSRTPTNKNSHTGLYEGYNLILITAESFSHLAIDPVLTPTLYKMSSQGYRFTNFYTPLWDVSTSDGEYVVMTGLYPKVGTWSFSQSSKNHMPFALGNQLLLKDYSTFAYHNHYYTYYDRHESHPNMGYRYQGVGNGLNIHHIWPSSDLEMIQNTVDDYIHLDAFHVYYMTVSGHLHYNFTGNHMAMRHKETVSDLPYSEPVRAYLATQLELEYALSYLLDALESSGKLDKTLIAISSDHYPYGLSHESIEELNGAGVDKTFERYRNAFILYATNMSGETVEKPMASIDILPTLSNLMGLTFDSRLLMGRDVFSSDPGLVVFHDNSFISPYGKYNAHTNTFHPNEGYEDLIDDAYVIEMLEAIRAERFFSGKILDTDYYRLLNFDTP